MDEEEASSTSPENDEKKIEETAESEPSTNEELIADDGANLLTHEVRCPHCDFLQAEKTDRCLMCGTALDAEIFLTADEQAEIQRERAEAAEAEAKAEQTKQAKRAARQFYRRPTPVFGLSVFFALFTLAVGGYGFLNPAAIPIALLPSATPTEAPLIVLPTETATPIPTATPLITETPTPTLVPTETSTPLPTDTPQPLRTYEIVSGQTLVGIASLFGFTLESIFEANGFVDEDPIVFVGQEILIPWPTATPPLQPILYDIGGQTLVIDPSSCPPFYAIQEGDSLFGLASANDIPLDAMLEMNYLTVDSIVQPGDPICIPQILEGPIFLPTPGPSPTPAPTQPPTGPAPLYPPDGFEHAAGDTVFLQWLSVEQLGAEERYMVEVIDTTDVDIHPKRLFTQSAGVPLPADWGPASGEHNYVWRVSVVEITGRRDNGGFIYSIVGAESVPRTFSWGN
ncbi:MAG: LysM peptidoglycan-binding domain-containing protein [Anaerolineae bacterium]